MNRQETFEQAFNAFVPAPDDNPECIGFYRAHAGLRAAWGEAFAERFSHVMHQAAGDATYAVNGSRYKVALQTARTLAAGQVIPPPARTVTFCLAEPSRPDWPAVRKLFNEQFKRAYPGKRVNSKFAEEQWLEKREKASLLVTQRYEWAYQKWVLERDRNEALNKRLRQERQAKLDAIEALQAAVKELND